MCLSCTVANLTCDSRNLQLIYVRHSHFLQISKENLQFAIFSPGFEILWDGASTGCGGRLTSPTGSITSPNYPQVKSL